MYLGSTSSLGSRGRIRRSIEDQRVWLGPKNTTGATAATAKVEMKIGAARRSLQVSAMPTDKVMSSRPKLTTVFLPIAPLQCPSSRRSGQLQVVHRSFRSSERRVGKVCSSTCISRLSLYLYKKNTPTINFVLLL